MNQSLNSLPDDPVLLKAMVLALQGKVESLQANEQAHLVLITWFKQALAKLRRQRFGASSEKIDREIAQLELALENLETAHPCQEPEDEQLPVPELATSTLEEPPNRPAANLGCVAMWNASGSPCVRDVVRCSIFLYFKVGGIGR
ncbi:hypothetical protein [Pseudovibrio sp. Tun.PSC04-5.I4]|uniref:IS66 family transposase n=1 Tax=Pseudovibrio sp. Tun.PSC04-5.I4 TaxID=1798213 RepID=UPI00088218E9|nr:Transposase C of IS166 homeodomain-containing protein [Pseudovibrio sp. Tun.PSC04-5.I4]